MPATKTFLNENGVTVTNKALVTAKGTFDFKRIRHIRIATWRRFPIFSKPLYRLTVDNFNEEIIAIETGDRDFIQRIQAAMNQAAQNR